MHRNSNTRAPVTLLYTCTACDRRQQADEPLPRCLLCRGAVVCISGDGRDTPPLPDWLNARLTICRTRCPHYLADSDLCGIQLAKGRAGNLRYMIDHPCPDCTCPASDPLWTPVPRFRTGGVGFIAVA